MNLTYYLVTDVQKVAKVQFQNNNLEKLLEASIFYPMHPKDFKLVTE